MFVPTILHKNYETASPSPSVNVGWCDYGVIGCQFSRETLLTITTLTEGGGDITLARKTMVFLQYRYGSTKILGFYLLVSIYFVKDCRLLLTASYRFRKLVVIVTVKVQLSQNWLKDKGRTTRSPGVSE